MSYGASSREWTMSMVADDAILNGDVQILTTAVRKGRDRAARTRFARRRRAGAAWHCAGERHHVQDAQGGPRAGGADDRQRPGAGILRKAAVTLTRPTLKDVSTSALERLRTAIATGQL